jgi:cytochrome b561
MDFVRKIAEIALIAECRHRNKLPPKPLAAQTVSAANAKVSTMLFMVIEHRCQFIPWNSCRERIVILPTFTPPGNKVMLRNRQGTYGLIAILLHWTIALLFAGQLALGFSMTSVKSMALQFELIQWHKSFGFVILGLALLRLLWHVASRRPAAPATMAPAERIAAKIVQTVLLTATIVVPLAGWALVSTSTLGIPTLAFNRLLIPHLPLEASEHAEAFWRQTHELLAYGTALLAAGHAAAALRHHFLLHDEVLRRMLPASGTPGRPGKTLENHTDA